MAKFGQHFLTNGQALKKIVSLLDLKKNDFVLEVGPGHGELTEKIMESGCSVTAIERDILLADTLREKFLGSEKIKIISGDALKIIPDEKIWNPEGRQWKFAGNIPYYITGKLLRTAGELAHKPDIFVITIQKEVAERLAAEPPKMNRLAASVQFWAEPDIALILPRSVFHPAPKVDSATVVLKPAPARKVKSGDYYKMVRAIFAQPRKTILNNISDGLGIPKKEVEAELGKIEIQPNLRPQNLSLEDIFKLVSVFKAE